MAYSLRTLQQFAIAISILSVFYNGAEGLVSIILGKESKSNSLIVFGVQSFVEVLSASLVLWRFAKLARPGEERTHTVPKELLLKERNATIAIGVLLGILAVGTWAASIVALVTHEQPNTSTPSLIISASALGLMILIWLPKPWLAKALDSSAMNGEAKCSLACISITSVLLAGTLIYRYWKGGWWVDSATAMVLGLLFLRESWNMVRWGMSKAFTGGCCKSCGPTERSERRGVEQEEDRSIGGQPAETFWRPVNDQCSETGTCTTG